MSLYALKPRFQALLRPRVTRMAERGTTANQVTLAAAAGSLVVGLGVAWLSDLRILFLLLPVWLAIRMALNAIDGMLAREFGQKSLLGAYLNEIADVVSDAALILPFATLPVFGPFWTGAVIVLAVISEFAGVMGPLVGASRRYDGPLGKSDRAFVFGALGLWIGLGLPLPGWFAWLMPLAVLFLTLTIVNRVHKGLREARAEQAQQWQEP
ncbi:CDP-alcohol phosphatidyltransferase [Labrys okinawensis]|uniref:CDP-alcohol phosphatidyltransferase n=2 Tax=Labrys TaxID=204476 RepID=A0A2S9QG55_9HYPH|nr:CDP-alcohol phosphatidyltransferase family protein [Labrys okinawensis]PRH88314.1 CDP-alcohol phosphatidyltransferase [Labrys okinawensis]